MPNDIRKLVLFAELLAFFGGLAACIVKVALLVKFSTNNLITGEMFGYSMAFGFNAAYLQHVKHQLIKKYRENP